MTSLIAVDIAILPPSSVAAAAIRLSAGLPARESQGLQLDDAHLPHITLTQQFVPRAALADVEVVVTRVLQRRPPLPLAIPGPGRGQSSVWMQVALTPELEELHRALMDDLKPFEHVGGTAAAFADGNARPGDLAWVEGFRRDASYRRFTPHITLGHAAALPPVSPLTFEAVTVALCHLGRFCTCREVLRSWTLEPIGKGSSARRRGL